MALSWFFAASFIGCLFYRWREHVKFDKIRSERETQFKVRTRTDITHIQTVIKDVASEIWKISSKPINKLPKDCTKLVYVMIPGNPGVSTVYVHWMRLLVSMFVGNDNNKYDEMDAYIISHANHCPDPFNYNNKKLFEFDEQINHKKDCIEYIIEQNKGYKDVHYVIGGHSIGSFITLKLLKHFENINIKQIHLWAPTIVNIGKSPNGLRTQKLFNYLGAFLPIVQFIMSYVLPIFQLWLVKLLFAKPSLSNADKVMSDIQCKHAPFFLNVIFMAQHEFKEVTDLDKTGMDQILKKYKEKIVFYWAKTDGWAHKQCWEDIKKLFAKTTDEEMNEVFAGWEIDANIKHAFIMDDVTKNVEIKLAQKILQWIK